MLCHNTVTYYLSQLLQNYNYILEIHFVSRVLSLPRLLASWPFNQQNVVIEDHCQPDWSVGNDCTMCFIISGWPQKHFSDDAFLCMCIFRRCCVSGMVTVGPAVHLFFFAFNFYVLLSPNVFHCLSMWLTLMGKQWRTKCFFSSCHSTGWNPVGDCAPPC